MHAIMSYHLIIRYLTIKQTPTSLSSDNTAIVTTNSETTSLSSDNTAIVTTNSETNIAEQ